MSEATKPVDHLRALHKEADDKDLNRPDILVIESLDMVRALVVRNMQTLFPGYNVVAVSNGEEARAKISSDLRDSLALVFADTADFASITDLLFELRQTKKDSRLVNHGKKVPVILMSAGISAEEIANKDTAEGTILGKALERRDLDGFIGKPFTPDQLASVLADSIAKRAGLFGKIEGSARERVLAGFIEYYTHLGEEWERTLKALIAASTGEVQEVLEDILGCVMTFKGNLVRMQKDINDKDLRQIIHDFNNNLVLLLANPEYILEGEISGSLRSTLEIFSAEIKKLHSDTILITSAVRGTISWTSANQPKLTPEIEQVLRCPAGMRFCVIDDNENVRTVCKRVIEGAGGRLTLTVSGPNDIQDLVDARAARAEIDVFLLDHELGGDAFGHQLIETIQTCYPRALIIGHTGEADDLNEDPENPYRQAGIEVVGKRQWSAVSGILRRKFNPGGDA